MFDVWETMKFGLRLQLQHGFTCKLNQIYLHRNGNFEHVMNNRVKESPSMSGKKGTLMISFEDKGSFGNEITQDKC